MLRSVSLLGVTALLVSGCASRQPVPDAKPTVAGRTSCSKLQAHVSQALASKLEAAADVISFESAWRSDHPNAVAGTINRPNVVGVIRARGNDIRGCYDAAMDKLPDDSRGRVVVRFIIDSSGRVPAATIAANELGVPEVACCLAERVSEWAFVPPTTGDFVVVEYPFSVKVSKS
jgi:hypothetical protein